MVEFNRNPETLEGDFLARHANSLHPYLTDRLRSWFDALKPKKDPYHHIVEGRKRIDPVAFARDFKKATHFNEFDADLVVTEDPIGFTRIVDGKEEHYLDKLAQERERSGLNEAVSWGEGRVGKNKIVEIVFNWQFMAASSGVVVGEKLLRAMKYAEQNHRPVVILFCSGGQRQQEAVPSLRGMPVAVYAIEEYKKKTNLLVISVIIGSTFGGITASAVPSGDLVVAMTGADFGFAGGRVINGIEGKEPPPGAQSVENSLLTNRAIQMAFNKLDELLKFLDTNLSILNGKAKDKKVKETTAIDLDGHIPSYKTPFRTGSRRKHPRAKIPVPPQRDLPEGEYKQYKALSSARRPDTLYTLRHAFDGFVPYFTGRLVNDEIGTHLIYPAIVAAAAYIDDPRLSNRLNTIVIGNQPEYIRLDDGVIVAKHPNPTAWDYRHQLKMLRFAERLGWEITSFVHTYGAKASIEDELAAQYVAIYECLKAQQEFPYFTRAYILGVSGSGGGLATLSADYIAQLGDAHEYVAPPEQATDILVKSPTEEDVIRTAKGMRPTADFSLKSGLIDRKIGVPKDGAQSDPLATVLAIREDIVRTRLEYGDLTKAEIDLRRRGRLENQKPIPVGYLEATRGRHRFHLPGH